jgi:GT2 family glycosyltransferase
LTPVPHRQHHRADEEQVHLSTITRPTASIVILAWNAWPITRSCLEVLRSSVGLDDEVIVVDNGSTDETRTALGGYPWVKVVRNDRNRGFAGGCNDGAAVATRDVVVFLNNDTLPVGRWLDELLEPMTDPTVTASGPRSNFVSGPQLVNGTSYVVNRTVGLRAFVEDWQREHRGRIEEAERLVGFCLAVRRASFEQVDGFDEDFGTGGYEDEDLCLRLRAAGGRLLISHGSFVHHHGHATFDANGVNWAAIEVQARDAFLDKHGSTFFGGSDEHLLAPLPVEAHVRHVAVVTSQPAPALDSALDALGITALRLAPGPDVASRADAADVEAVITVGSARSVVGLDRLSVPVVAWSPAHGIDPVGWYDTEGPTAIDPAEWLGASLDRLVRLPSFGALLLRCRWALEHGLLAEATHAASLAERIRPGTVQVLNAMAVCSHVGGETAEAVQLLRRAVELDPTYQAAAENLAALTGEGQP